MHRYHSDGMSAGSQVSLAAGSTYSVSPRVSDLPDSRRAGHSPCHCLHLREEEQFRQGKKEKKKWTKMYKHKHTQTNMWKTNGCTKTILKAASLFEEKILKTWIRTHFGGGDLDFICREQLSFEPQ